MDRREYIHADPEVLAGKPVVKGTRLAVEFLLGLLGAGWSHEQILANYPTLTSEALQALDPPHLRGKKRGTRAPRGRGRAS